MQAAVGSHCLECAKAARPDMATRVKYAQARVMTPATYALVGANLLVFALMVLADPRALGGDLTQWHADLGLDRCILQGQFACDPRYPVQADQWYRLVTAGFIHFGVFHVLMNMFLLWQLGMLLERALGAWRFLALYAAGLFAGSFGVLLLTAGGVTGGASGAVFGLMAGAAVGMHRRGVNVFSTGIGTTLLLNLVITFTIPGISIGGHLGGAIGGAICGWALLAPSWKPLRRSVAWLVPAAVVLVSIIGSVLVVRGTA